MLTFDAPAANGTATARKNGRAANGFAHLENWVFDLDNTLYPAACNLFAQVDVKIGQFVADLLKIGMDEAVKIQKEYFRTYGTSLRGLMLHHQVDPDAFLDFVHEIDVTLIPPCPGAGSGAGAAAGAEDHLHQRLPQACRERHQPAGHQQAVRGDLRHQGGGLRAEARSLRL